MAGSLASVRPPQPSSLSGKSSAWKESGRLAVAIPAAPTHHVLVASSILNTEEGSNGKESHEERTIGLQLQGIRFSSARTASSPSRRRLSSSPEPSLFSHDLEKKPLPFRRGGKITEDSDEVRGKCRLSYLCKTVISPRSILGPRPSLNSRYNTGARAQNFLHVR